MAYLDNIIIYFNTKKENKEYVKQVLRKLYKENIPVAIKKWLDKTELFTKMTKKDKPWRQDNDKIRLFKEIKQEFTRELILKIYQLILPIRVEINILDFILRVCLLQKHDKVQYLVVYYSQKMTPLELNYNIYNKELLGIIAAFKE